MRTTDKEGKLLSFDDLLNSFWFRLDTLMETAEELRGNEAGRRVELLANGIVSLMDDWKDLEEALVAREVALHPEDWTEDTQRHYAAMAALVESVGCRLPGKQEGVA